MKALRSAVAAVLFCLPLLAAAEALRFGDPGQTPTVIELFTSQGCSSCPPAEARLNAYVRDSQLWNRYIPLAFHVDYWDYLGWKDRLADPAYSARQRAYAASGRLSTVYTPAFVVNGREWRSHRFGDKPSGAAVSGLSVILAADGGLEVRPAAPAPRSLMLNVALLGMDLESDIDAGENRGRHSRHDFVVLKWSRVAVHATPWRAELPSVPDGAAKQYAVAVWLNRPGDPAPLYAAGAYLPAQFGSGKAVTERR